MRFDSRNSFEIRHFIAVGQDRKTGEGLIHVQALVGVTSRSASIQASFGNWRMG